MGIFFDSERRLRAAIAGGSDIAASIADPAQRDAMSRRVAALRGRLPGGAMESLLIGAR